MIGTLTVSLIITIFLIQQHRYIKHHKSEKKWIYLFSILTMMFSFLLSIPLPIHRFINFLNGTIGKFALWMVTR
jgi:ABC-type multidrug transport system permease subunit